MSENLNLNLAGIDWIPVRSAAKGLKISRQRIYQLANNGKLVSIRVEGIVLISAASMHDRLIKMVRK